MQADVAVIQRIHNSESISECIVPGWQSGSDEDKNLFVSVPCSQHSLTLPSKHCSCLQIILFEIFCINKRNVSLRYQGIKKVSLPWYDYDAEYSHADEDRVIFLHLYYSQLFFVCNLHVSWALQICIAFTSRNSRKYIIFIFICSKC